MRLNPGIMAFTLVPVVMMLLTFYTTSKKTDYECHAPLFMQILGFLYLGILILGVSLEPTITTFILGAILALLFPFAIAVGIYTKIRFKSECIELITFGIKRKYEYRNMQRIEVKYIPDTQLHQEVTIVFPRKKIRISYVFVGYYDVEQFLRERLKEKDLKVPWVRRDQGISKRKEKKKNRYRPRDWNNKK